MRKKAHRTPRPGPRICFLTTALNIVFSVPASGVYEEVVQYEDVKI